MCVFRCDTTAPLAGFPQTLKPISWEWEQQWPSGDFSSISQEPMKEVRTGQRWTLISFNVCVCVCVLFYVCVSSAGVQMEMTAPVLVKIPEETKMWEPAIYTLNFPLPAAYQDKPPAPTNDKVSCPCLSATRSNAFISPVSACNLILASRSIKTINGYKVGY